jgi:uroporphyrinogen-III synthase
MIPVIVIRPQPGCNATVAAAQALGLEAHGFPLFDVGPLAWVAPDPGSFDALLLGSANVLRHAGVELKAYRGKPTYAVGLTTADAAKAAGLDVVACGEGGLQALLSQLRPEHRQLLRLTGREHVELTPPPGVTLVERLVYASEPQPMPAALVSLLHQPALVLLHSAEAARHFARQCGDHSITRSQIQLAALGPRIADAAGQGWGSLGAAAAPNDNAMLALVQQMCQNDTSSTDENRA